MTTEPRTQAEFSVIDRYPDFYTDYAASHHNVTSFGGWFVWDYDDAFGGHRTAASAGRTIRTYVQRPL